MNHTQKTMLMGFSLDKILLAGLCLLWPLQLLAVDRNASILAAVDNGDSSFKLERHLRGIPARLIDSGDFYFRPDGTKIRLLRKKDVFAVATNGVNRNRAIRRIKTKFGNRVELLSTHQLSGLDVVRLDNGPSVNKLQKSKRFHLSADMLAALDSSIEKVTVVFANQRGNGDIVLVPGLTIKLNSEVDAETALLRIKRRYGLQLKRKLKLSGNVYSMGIRNSQISESQQFAMVRAVMRDPDVRWAEPQFNVRPFKTTFEPNDPLFDQQWHLRNTGMAGSRCDTDCDANNAWDLDIDGIGGGDQGVGAVSGDGTVIAIIDDGVQLDHEDLNIFVNPGEIAGNGQDDDGNGFIDDVNGFDFVDDATTNLKDPNNNLLDCANADDGVLGQDGDPGPQPTTACITAEGDDVEQDNHGTSVAGLAAAIGANSKGVAGTAFAAEILAIRLISAFDGDNSSDFCNRAAEAMEYAGRFADVVNASWGLDTNCQALNDAIDNVVSGDVMFDLLNDAIMGEVNVSKRKSTDTGSGSPVVFASGNSASGWIKITASVSAGEHAYEWRLLRSDIPAFDGSDDDDTVWLDDIIWPDDSTESFEGDLSAFDMGNVLDTCNAACVSLVGTAGWEIESLDTDHVLSGTQSARMDAAISGSECSNTFLHALREDIGGEISFWVWVSTDTQGDRFEFLIDGKEIISFGDFPIFVGNSISYPANLGSTIAVGASNAGDLSGQSTPDPFSEQRVPYSQFGPQLDVMAPSHSQHLGVTTTDRSGLGDGFNVGAASDHSDTAYTNAFGGTSAAAPIVAGVAAAMIAVEPTLDAVDIKSKLRQSADKIGNLAYTADGAVGDGTRNDFYGYGRVNMLRALQSAAGDTLTSVGGTCNPDAFSYLPSNDLLLPAFQPQALEFCPAQGALPASDDFCVPIKTSNGNIAIVCL